MLGLLVSPLWGGACGVRHLLGRAGTPAHFPSLCLSVGSAPACQQAEAAILLTRRMLCMLYTGILTAICQWLHCHPYCDCFCTRSSGFPFFRCRRCLCRRGIAVAQVHSLSIALTPGACSPPCLGGGRPAPTEAIKDNHAKLPCMSNAESQGNVLQQKPIPATLGGVKTRCQCRSHPPNTRSVTRIAAPTNSIPETGAADSPGKGQGGEYRGGSSRGPETYIHSYLHSRT